MFHEDPSPLVCPRCDRSIDTLRLRMLSCNRSRFTCEVPESNMVACMFFKSCGAIATEVLREWFGSEDGYLFKWRMPQNAAANS